MHPEHLVAIRNQIRKLIRKKYETLAQIEMRNLDFNPFLLRALSLETCAEIAEFMVLQRIERSVVTSYGLRIQNIAKTFATGTGVEGADICKEKDRRRYYIQMKAGPNTPNKDLVRMINRLLRGAVRRNRGAVGLLGMTYGKRQRVSGIIQQYSDVDWLIGSEFWAFIAGEQNCARELFDLICEEAETPPEGFTQPYPQLLRQKIESIAHEIRANYGDGGPEMWDKLFADNM